jgi:hypothetical protein
MKVGTRTYPPVVSVGPVKKPTYEELEAEVARLREKITRTARLADQNGKLAKDRGDRIQWLINQARAKK